MKKLSLAVGSIAAAASAAAFAQAPQQRGDGVHTRAEIVQRVQRMFGRADANRDGFVTAAEGQAAMAQRGQRWADPARQQRRAARAFDRLDANRDGAISRSEFEARRASRGHGGRAGGARHARALNLGEQMFGMADVNRDNRLSLQEATNAALQHFDHADANRDGQVTREERRQMRGHMPVRG